MRIRTLLAAAVLAGAATLPMAGTALAADRDCPDFASQEAAQWALESTSGDPERLDADGDGFACEDRFGEEPGDGTEPADGTTDDAGDSGDDGAAPVGAVAAGGGGTAGGSVGAGPLAVAGASVLVAGAAFAANRRSGRQRG
jgi:hypothetical protein